MARYLFDVSAGPFPNEAQKAKMKAQIILFALSMASTVHPFAIFPSSFWSKNDAVKARGNRGFSHQQHVLLNSHFEKQQQDDGESGSTSVRFCSGPSGNKRHLADCWSDSDFLPLSQHNKQTRSIQHTYHCLQTHQSVASPSKSL